MEREKLSGKKGGKLHLLQKALSALLVIVMLVTWIPVELYVQATSTGQMEVENQENAVTGENIASEGRDWSEDSSLHYILTGMERMEADYWYKTTLDIYFEALTGERGIQADDKVVFEVPDEWFYIQDTKEPLAIYSGDIQDVGNPEAVLTDQAIAQYTVKDQKVEVCFLKSVGDIEDIASVFGRIDLQLRLNRKALTLEEQRVEWTIQKVSEKEERKLEIMLPADQPIDWAQRTEDFTWDIKEVESEDGKDIGLYFHFLRVNEDIPVKAGDTASIYLGDREYQPEVCQEPVPVNASLYIEEKETQVPIATYQYDGSTLVVTFTEEMENPEHLTKMQGMLDLIDVSSPEGVQNQKAEGTDQDTVVGLGGLELTVSATNEESMNQEVYWVDNNTVTVRPGKEGFLEFYKENGKIQVGITVGKGEEKVVELTVAELAEALGVTPEELLQIEDAQGTGHYQMSIPEGILPVKGTVTDEDEKVQEVNLTWKFLAPEKAPDNYYYVDKMNPEESEELEPGWYYIRTQDFTIELVHRRGDGTADFTGLSQEILKQFSFYWTQNNGDTEYREITLEELSTQLGVRFDRVDIDGNPAVAKMVISNVPMYRTDGTENRFYVSRISSTPEQDADKLNLSGLKDGDYIKVTYENDDVANVGTVVDRVYSGGSVYMTLAGNTEYTGHKIWGDAGFEKANRPDLEFQLWRYTKKEGESYKHASPVKNSDNEIVLLTVDSSKLSQDEFDISFVEDENSLLPGLEGENVYLDALEKLPKYDPEGYEYVYFSREIVKATPGADAYTRLYGAIKEEDGTLTLVDTLPDGYEGIRESSDTSIYNDGTLINRLSGNVKTKVDKTWAAAAFQDEFKDVKVVMTLQSRVKDDEDAEWIDAEKDGEPITVTLEGFTAEQLTRSDEATADKYNYWGEELEYRWVETAVYQGESEENLLEENGKFTLQQAGKNVGYISEHGKTIYDKETNTFKTPITNRMSDAVDYEITKLWDDGNGNISSVGPDGAEIEIQIYQQSHIGEAREIGEPIKLDGKKDEEKSTFEVKTDGSATPVVVSYQEVEPWQLKIEGLPKYSAEGHEYTYYAMENMGPDGYVPRYSTELIEDTYHTTITNTVGNSQQIYVKKLWLDDSDTLHRGDVKFGIYQRNGEKQFEAVKVENNTNEVAVTAKDFWWKIVSVPDGVDVKNIFVVETAVWDTLNEKWVTIEYTPEEMEQIYEAQKEVGAETHYYKEFETGNHLYREHFSKTEMAGNEFYTVINQRLGTIDLTITKDWRDGENNAGVRDEFLEMLVDGEGNEISLGLRLVCVDDKAVIDEENGTVNIGDKAEQIMQPGENGLVPAGAIQEIDTSKSSSQYYFFNLPKYTEIGEVIHYTVEEIVKYADGKIETFEEFKQKNSKIIYSSVMEASEYNTGNQHTHDTQEFAIHNTITGVKDVLFRKMWKDQYRFKEGERPDISLNIYRMYHNDPKDSSAVTVETFYKDYEWEKVEQDGVELDLWDITIPSLPKYDQWGYEIIYYAKENVNIARENFDYQMPTYRYRVNPDASGEAAYATVGSEVEGAYDGFEDKDYTILSPSGDGAYLLKENGTFVNKIEEDVVFNGKKIWQQIPSGFSEAHLPPITFELWRKGTGEGGKDEKISWVTIDEWKKLADGSYQYAMNYVGENTNTVTDGAGSLEVGGDTTKLIPQYDDNGELYQYYIEEVVHYADSEEHIKEDPIFDTTILGGVVYNSYSSEKGKIVLKKIVDVQRPLESGEGLPSLAFALTRYYKDGENLIEDESFLRVEEKNSKDYTRDEAAGIGTMYVSFDNLEIFAPNGSKYQYVVKEQTDQLNGGYDVFIARGDKEVHDSVFAPESMSDPVYIEAEKDKADQPADITFKNVRKQEVISIYGTKTWRDRYDLAGLRPEFTEDGVENAIQFQVKRWADAQGTNNAIKEIEILPEVYTVQWEEGTDSGTWKYTITGNDGTNELEKYSPNGNRWRYAVIETLKPPYDKYYPNTPQRTEAKENGKVDRLEANFANQLYVNAYTKKEWSPWWNEGKPSLISWDYKMKITYKLQARVDGVVKKGEKEVDAGIKSYWVDASDLQTWSNNGGVVPENYGERTVGPLYVNHNDWSKDISYNGMVLGIKVTSEQNWSQVKVVDSDFNIASGAESVLLKYRAVEAKIEYYESDGKTLVLTQNVKANAKPEFDTDGKEIYDLQIASSEPEIEGGLFEPELQESAEKEHTIHKNRMDVVNLEIWKIWKDDDKNNYNTRPLDNGGNSIVYFVVQRREKGTKDTWENAKEYDSNGKEKDLVRDKRIPVNTKAGNVKIEDLPKYGLVKDKDNHLRRIEYEYRAMELKADANVLDGVQEEEIIQDGGIFNSAYNVSVKTDKDEIAGEIADFGHRPTEGYDYYTGITNALETTELYAQKDWGQIDDNMISYPVTLRLQYRASDKEGKEVWEDFKTKDGKFTADVQLDGEKDPGKVDSQYSCYEYEDWQAKWIRIPVRMPGSLLENEKSVTQYRIVEITDNSFAENALSGEGSDKDPYVFDFKEEGDQDNPYKITNTPTRLKISKRVDGEEATKDFTFTIKASDDAGKSQYVSYQKYKKNKDNTYDKTGGLIPMDLSGNKIGTFELKGDEYVMVYGLVKGASYMITESSASEGEIADYVTTVTYNGQTVAPDSENSKQYTITMSKNKPYEDSVVEVAFRNSIDAEGKITIKKKDEKGNPLEGVVFRLKWKEKGASGVYNLLTDKECGNPAIIEGADSHGAGTVKTNADGEAVFDKLSFPGNGYDYQITEVETADGYHHLIESIEGISLPYITTTEPSGDEEPWKIEDGKYYYKEITITVENNKIMVMPQTNGIGFFWPGLAGMAAVISVGGYYIWQEEKKRKKNRKNN